MLWGWPVGENHSQPEGYLSAWAGAGATTPIRPRTNIRVARCKVAAEADYDAKTGDGGEHQDLWGGGRF